jgi:DNA-binding XRE family transcriptional regulator
VKKTLDEVVAAIGDRLAINSLPSPDELEKRRTGTLATRAEMAVLVGVTSQTIWNWEKGKRRPTGDAALRYATILDLLAPKDARR